MERAIMSFFNKIFGGKKPMAWQDFVSHYADYAVGQLGQPADIDWGDSIDDTVMRFSDGNGGSHATYLGNFYALYCQNPDDLDGIVAGTFASLLEARGADELEDVSAHLFPVIKNTEWVAQSREQMRQAYPDGDIENVLVFMPLAGDLVLTYVLDMDNSMRYFTRHDFADQALDLNDVHALAEQNFLAYAGDKVGLKSFDGSSLVLFSLDGNYEATLLLYLRELLESAGLPFADDCAFAVPTRDAVLACAADDAAALAQMREAAAELAERSPYRVSQYFYRRKDGEITLLDEVLPH